MDALLVKIFATALTLSQATSGPDALKIQFDRVADQKEVVSLLRAGCLNMRKAFDIEDVNVDDLIATVMDDPDVVSGTMPAFKGLNLNDLLVAYRQFCKNETVTNSPVDLAEVIDFRNKAVADLPDPSRLKDLKLPSASVVLDAKGERFAEIFEANQRRVFVPLGEIPEHVQKAFIAAEDKRFYQHKGVDERALIRAFIGNLAKPGRPQGGSTITQQVVKNLAVGDDPTYERKIREMIVATDLERVLTKPEILQLYLNSTYLGRGSWGVEMAARSYFGKSAKELTLAEGALLAGLTKGPTAFNPDRYPERAQERLAYVLTRMQEDGAISTEEMKQAQNALPRMVADERPRRDTGFHFIDHLSREPRPSRESISAPPTLIQCARRSSLRCSARPRPRCRKASRATRWTTTACSSRAPRQTCPTRSSASKRKAKHRRKDRPGSRPSKARAFLSTTCIGRQPWWSKRRPPKAAGPSRLASLTGAS